MYADPDPECDDEDAWGTVRTTAVPLAVAAAFAGPYLVAYGFDRSLDYAAMLGPDGEWLQFAAMGGLLVLHGAVHAVAYALLGEGSWRDVTVEASLFPGGIDPVSVSVVPDASIRRSAYLVGLAAPGVLLGLAPAAWALATGSPLALFVGLVGILLTGSDVSELLGAVRSPDAAGVAEFASS